MVIGIDGSALRLGMRLEERERKRQSVVLVVFSGLMLLLLACNVAVFVALHRRSNISMAA
jgi:hypothetical protein